MLLSVVIPTYHRNDLLRLCLEGLSPTSQTLNVNDYEVIVSDDGNESNAKEMIENEFPWCKWSQGPQKGPASNRNFGASLTKNDWIVFIDDDCIPDKNILLIYKTELQENSNIKVFEGCIKADREKIRFDEESPINVTGGYMWSCNFMIDKKTFNELNGFDENFPSPAMEDVDLTDRVRQAGYKILFLENAYVIHPYRRSRSISFVKKHHDSFVYFSNKNEQFKKKQTLGKFFKSYIKSWLYILRNAYKYKFRGVFVVILVINYNLILKLHYVLIKK